MITEKTVKKTRFFTTDGTDMWKVAHVKTLTVVDLVNCENGKTATIRLGEPATIGFVPVVMPKVNSGGRPPGSRRETRGQEKVKAAKVKAGTTKKTGPGVRTGTKRGKYKRTGIKRGTYQVKRCTIHENGQGVPAGEKAASQYLGVSVQKARGGKKRYVAQLRNAGGHKHLGSYKTEELAAAAVQEYLGKEEEAAGLRKLAEQKTDREIAELKKSGKVTAFDCTNCGKGYQYKPDVCGKCGSSSFIPARPENQVVRNKDYENEIQTYKF